MARRRLKNVCMTPRHGLQPKKAFEACRCQRETEIMNGDITVRKGSITSDIVSCVSAYRWFLPIQVKCLRLACSPFHTYIVFRSIHPYIRIFCLYQNKRFFKSSRHYKKNGPEAPPRRDNVRSSFAETI